MSVNNKIEYTGLEVAVIGMACKFPDAENLNEFWNNIYLGKESVTFYTKRQVVESGVAPELANDPHYVNSNGGEITDKFGFDAEFFNYTADEALLLDPQIRLMHECVYNALLDAGYPASVFKGNIGLFAGSSPNQLWEVLCSLSDTATKMGGWAANHLSNKDFGATLVSYKLGLKGPSVNIDVGCSTSLVAVHMATRSLLLGECDIAVAGGTSVGVRNTKGYLYNEGLIASPDGHCRAFDRDASGTFFGNGSGMVVLKLLRKAIDDHDNIYAVIKGSAVNNDGNRKGGYTAPSVQGQADVIRAALKFAKVNPESIGFIETHGTATKLGDPIEIKSLSKAFNTAKRNYCYLGALKANIGHLDTAAGVAGFIKAVMVIKNQCIPPVVNFVAPNPLLGIENSPFTISTKSLPWESTALRRAGVSSFGIGGTNAHVILEEFTQKLKDTNPPNHHHIFVLSARSQTALDLMKINLRKHVEANENLDLFDFTFTLQLGRENLPYKESAVFKDRRELLEIFENDTFKRSNVNVQNKKMVFAFPGQGMQYARMGRELYLKIPLFRNTLKECFDILKTITEKDFAEILFSNTDDGTINQTINSQPILFSFQYALSKMLQAWGIQPDAFIGHSIGEYLAACLSGVFSLKDALYIVTKRAEFMQGMETGSMLAINLSCEEVIKFKPASISFASINSPVHCVVSGNTPDIKDFAQILAGKGINATILKTSHAFHSSMMHNATRLLEEALANIQFQSPKIPFISNVSGNWISATQCQSPEYWSKQLEATVQLHKGTSKILEWPDVLVLEIGPGNSLSTFIRNNENFTRRHQAHSLITPASAQNISDWEYLMRRLSDLWLSGIELDWRMLHGESPAKRISLPNYSFVHKDFVLDHNILTNFLKGARQQEGKAQLSEWFYTSSWKKSTSLKQSEIAMGIWLIVGFDKIVVSSLARCISQNSGSKVYSLIPGSSQEILRVSDSFEIDRNNVHHYAKVLDDLNQSEDVIRIIDLSFLNVQDEIDVESINVQAMTHLLYLAKALSKLTQVSQIRLNCVTSDNYDVLGHEEISQNASTLASVLKVISQEYFHIKSKNIDASVSENFLQCVCEEASDDNDDPVVAIRNNFRWTPFVEKIVPQAYRRKNGFNIQPGNVYLITGGLGKVGCVLANYLSSSGGKVVLLGRTKLTGTGTGQREKQRRLEALRSISANVVYMEVDVTKFQNLQEAVVKIEDEVGIIRGVFHLAASEVSHSAQYLIQNTDIDECLNKLESKVNGVRNIKKVFERRPLEFAVLFSSLSSILGGVGYFSYAASNAYLDRFARMNNKINGTHWVSINWDAWSLSDTANNNASELMITEKEGKEIFANLNSWITHHELIVSVHDLEERLRKWVFKIEDQKSSNASVIPELERPGLLDQPELPRNQVEQDLLIIWKSLFGYKTIGVKDDFFELGGDSLKGLRLINAIRSKFNKEISLSDFFTNPSIRGVSAYIGSGTADQSQIPSVEKKDHYVMSSSQRRLYVLNALNKSSLAYNMPKVFKVNGSLNKMQLQKAFDKLFNRHEILRTSIVIVDNEPVQMILDNVNFKVEYFYSSDSKIDHFVKQFIRPFNLENDLLLRLGVVETSQKESYLLVDIHHIVTDGVSYNILLRDFNAFYCDASLPPLKLQYKDYAEWQQSLGQQMLLTDQKDFWIKEFYEEVVPLELPLDFPRPIETSYNGDSIDFNLSEAQIDKLKLLSRKEGTTLFVTLLAIYNVLLSKLSNQEDIVIGTPVAGRSHADLEGIMGMFVNTLALRNFPKEDLTFRDFLSDVKIRTLRCLDNQSFQYEDLIDALNVPRNTNRNPLFDVMFSYESVEGGNPAIPDLMFEQCDSGHRVSKFDITLWAVESGDRIFFSFEYSTDLFQRDSIERFIKYFKNIVSVIVEDADRQLSEIEVVTEEEKYQLLYGFNNTKVDYPREETIVSLFERQVLKTPDDIAVISGEIKVSYKELNETANRLARYLKRKCNVKPDDIIGIVSRKSERLIIGILAILKAGGAYLPIDPTYPTQRVRLMIENSNLCGLIKENDDENVFQFENVISLTREAQFIAQESNANLETRVGSENLFYVIYTSGSTGTPKGVMVKHGSFLNLINWYGEALELTESDIVLLIAPLSFDLAQKNIFVPLVHGASLYLSEHLHLDYPAIAETIEKFKVSVVNVAPSAFYPLLETNLNGNYSKIRSLKKVVLGGEPINMKEMLKWSKSKYFNAQLINSYGPTECTDVVSFYEVTRQNFEHAENVPIGKPIDNTQLYILSSKLKLLPIGVIGDIYIGGEGISKGYYGNSVLTAEKFLKDPFSETGLIYKTGDLGRWNDEGNIEFLGRKDDQIKIRGLRIELGEIENQLYDYGLINELAVIAKESGDNKYLVAYYVPKASINVTELRNFLSARLPDYMVPAYFVEVNKLPLTPSGKLDKKALPPVTIMAGSEYVAPSDETEEKLVEIWSSVLNIDADHISVDRSFFDLGGNSLKMIRLNAILNAKLGWNISIPQMFRYPTILSLVEFIKYGSGGINHDQMKIKGEIEEMEKVINLF